MFTLRAVNFSDSIAPEQFIEMRDAMAYGIARGVDFAIDCFGETVVGWSMVGGFKFYDSFYARFADESMRDKAREVMLNNSPFATPRCGPRGGR